MSNKIVQVAVGVVQNAQGDILIARRPDTAHQGGLWEFPGGKVDPGETLDKAFTRELLEELAIEVHGSSPLIEIHHDYPDKSVWLEVRRITRFSGEPKGNEGQPVRWVSPSDLPRFDFPAANRPIVNALRLPDEMLVTGPAKSDQEWLARLESALKRGVLMVQCRWPNSDPDAYRARFQAALALCRKHGVPLIANCPVEHWIEEADGLHLSSHQLFHCTQRPVPLSVWLGASCHNEAEIEQAQAIGVDYVTVSPVMATGSHPEAEPLGWDHFAQLTKLARVPVYGLGGLQPSDKDKVKRAGGQGIAGIGYAWRGD